MRLRRSHPVPDAGPTQEELVAKQRLEEWITQADAGNQDILPRLFSPETGNMAHANHLRDFLEVARERLRSQYSAYLAQQETRQHLQRWVQLTSPGERFDWLLTILRDFEHLSDEVIRKLTTEEHFDLGEAKHEAEMYVREAASELLREIREQEGFDSPGHWAGEWRRMIETAKMLKRLLGDFDVNPETLVTEWDELVARRFNALKPDNFSESYAPSSVCALHIDAARALLDEDMVKIAKILAYVHDEWHPKDLPSTTLHELAMELVELRKRDEQP